MRERLEDFHIRRRTKRRIALGILGLLAFGALWIVVTGLIARSEASKLDDQLHVVKELVADGRIVDAEHAATGIPGLARRAHLLTTGPAWWTAAHVPYFGKPLKVMRGATVAGKQVGVDGVGALLHIASTLDPNNLRAHGDTIKIDPLIQAGPALASASRAMDHAEAVVDALPSSTWFGPVDKARASFSAQLHAVVGYIDAAANATRVMPGMLGSTHPLRYFVGLQNEAEMRGTGGLPGAFAIATVNNGTIKFEHFYSDGALLPQKTHQLIDTGLDFGKDFDRLYGSSAPTSLYVNTNLSPNFPYAAQVWAAMWQKVSGEHVDGAIALDPTALAYFLSVTGPVTLPSGLPVTAQDIVPLTEKDEYAIFSDNNQRKQFLVDVMKAASTKLTSGAGSASQLARTMVTLSNQQRLQIWSSNPEAEKVLAGTSYGGVVPPASRPLAAMVVNNIAGGKLDYYLGRSIEYHRVGCGSSRDVFVTMTLRNSAPAVGLPSYVTTRGDSLYLQGRTQPGDNRTLLDYYATNGAELLEATVNGQEAAVAVLHDLGHPVYRLDLELPRGTTTTVTLRLTEPPQSGAPVVWRQPGVSPLQVAAFNQAC